MPKPQPLSCWTCGTIEPHHPLTGAQKVWLRARIDEDYVEQYCMCAKAGCRNVRTYGTERRFRGSPLRIPKGVD